MTSAKSYIERSIPVDNLTEGFQVMMDQSKDLFCIADLKTATFRHVNHAFLDVLGYDYDEILSKPFLEFIHPDDILKTSAVIEQELNYGKRVIKFENRYLDKDGNIVYLEWNSFPVIEKKIVYAIARDVTKTKLQVSELEKKQSQLLKFIDFSPTALVVTNGINKVEAVNRAFKQLYGYEIEDIKWFDQWFVKAYPDPLYRKEVIEKWKKTIKDGPNNSGIISEPITVINRTKFGADIVVECHVGFVDNKVLVTFNDITDLRKTEQELRESKNAAEKANVEKSKLLAVVNHELRTPLNSIMGPCELLKQDISDSENKELIDIVHSSAQYMLNLVNGILDLSRVESGQVEVNLTTVILKDFLCQSIAPLKIQAEAKGLKFETLFEIPDGSSIQTDEQILTEVLYNLAGNAIKFTKNGKITCSVKQIDHQYISIEIMDTGCGIGSNEIKSIFQPFHQGTNVDQSTQKGSGLGLAITKELVELLNGTIHAESNPNKGSSFRITLKQ